MNQRGALHLHHKARKCIPPRKKAPITMKVIWSKFNESHINALRETRQRLLATTEPDDLAGLRRLKPLQFYENLFLKKLPQETVPLRRSLRNDPSSNLLGSEIIENDHAIEIDEPGDIKRENDELELNMSPEINVCDLQPKTIGKNLSAINETIDDKPLEALVHNYNFIEAPNNISENGNVISNEPSLVPLDGSDRTPEIGENNFESVELQSNVLDPKLQENQNEAILTEPFYSQESIINLDPKLQENQNEVILAEPFNSQESIINLDPNLQENQNEAILAEPFYSQESIINLDSCESLVHRESESPNNDIPNVGQSYSSTETGSVSKNAKLEYYEDSSSLFDTRDIALNLVNAENTSECSEEPMRVLTNDVALPALETVDSKFPSVNNFKHENESDDWDTSTDYDSSSSDDPEPGSSRTIKSEELSSRTQNHDFKAVVNVKKEIFEGMPGSSMEIPAQEDGFGSMDENAAFTCPELEEFLREELVIPTNESEPNLIDSKTVFVSPASNTIVTDDNNSQSQSSDATVSINEGTDVPMNSSSNENAPEKRRRKRKRIDPFPVKNIRKKKQLNAPTESATQHYNSDPKSGLKPKGRPKKISNDEHILPWIYEGMQGRKKARHTPSSETYQDINGRILTRKRKLSVISSTSDDSNDPCYVPKCKARKEKQVIDSNDKIISRKRKISIFSSTSDDSADFTMYETEKMANCTESSIEKEILEGNKKTLVRNPIVSINKISVGVRTEGKIVYIRSAFFFTPKVLPKLATVKIWKNVGLVIYPGTNIPLHPTARKHLDKVREDCWSIDKQWASFATSAVVSNSLPQRRILPAKVQMKPSSDERIIENFKKSYIYRKFEELYPDLIASNYEDKDKEKEDSIESNKSAENPESNCSGGLLLDNNPNLITKNICDSLIEDVAQSQSTQLPHVCDSNDEVKQILDDVITQLENSIKPIPPVKELKVVLNPLKIKNILPFCLFHERYLCIKCGLDKKLRLTNVKPAEKAYIEKGMHIKCVSIDKINGSNKKNKDNGEKDDTKMLSTICTTFQSFFSKEIQYISSLQLREYFIFDMINVFYYRGAVYVSPNKWTTENQFIQTGVTNVKMQAFIPTAVKNIFYKNYMVSPRCVLIPEDGMWKCNLIRYQSMVEKHSIACLYSGNMNNALSLNSNYFIFPMKRDFDYLILPNDLGIAKSSIMESTFKKATRRNPQNNEEFGVYKLPECPNFICVGPFNKLQIPDKLKLVKSDRIIPFYSRTVYGQHQLVSPLEKLIKRFTNHLMAGNYLIDSLWLQTITRQRTKIGALYYPSNRKVNRNRLDKLVSNVPKMGYLTILHREGRTYLDRRQDLPIDNLNHLNSYLFPDEIDLPVTWTAYPKACQMAMEHFCPDKSLPSLNKFMNFGAASAQEKTRLKDFINLSRIKKSGSESADTRSDISICASNIFQTPTRNQLVSASYTTQTNQISFEHSYSSPDEGPQKNVSRVSLLKPSNLKAAFDNLSNEVDLFNESSVESNNGISESSSISNDMALEVGHKRLNITTKHESVNWAYVPTIRQSGEFENVILQEISPTNDFPKTPRGSSVPSEIKNKSGIDNQDVPKGNSNENIRSKSTQISTENNRWAEFNTTRSSQSQSSFLHNLNENYKFSKRLKSLPKSSDSSICQIRSEADEIKNKVKENLDLVDYTSNMMPKTRKLIDEKSSAGEYVIRGNISCPVEMVNVAESRTNNMNSEISEQAKHPPMKTVRLSNRDAISLIKIVNVVGSADLHSLASENELPNLRPSQSEEESESCSENSNQPSSVNKEKTMEKEPLKIGYSPIKEYLSSGPFRSDNIKYISKIQSNKLRAVSHGTKQILLSELNHLSNQSRLPSQTKTMRPSILKRQTSTIQSDCDEQVTRARIKNYNDECFEEAHKKVEEEMLVIPSSACFKLPESVINDEPKRNVSVSPSNRPKSVVRIENPRLIGFAQSSETSHKTYLKKKLPLVYIPPNHRSEGTCKVVKRFNKESDKKTEEMDVKFQDPDETEGSRGSSSVQGELAVKSHGSEEVNTASSTDNELIHLAQAPDKVSHTEDKEFMTEVGETSNTKEIITLNTLRTAGDINELRTNYSETRKAFAEGPCPSEEAKDNDSKTDPHKNVPDPLKPDQNEPPIPLGKRKVRVKHTPRRSDLIRNTDTPPNP